MRSLFLFICISFIIIPSSFSQSKRTSIDSLYPGLEFRNIGPFRGGRSVASSGVTSDPQTYYMGTVGGGVWKTIDAGITWSNITDGQLNTSSVGAIAVSESDPNVIYVGMGEHSIRGVMTSHGDGVYKSEDAGKTWKHLGLPNSRHISEIRIHPADPNTVYVAVQGAAYGASVERGVYRTGDGGKNWDKILYIDDTTGASDISIDVNNPRILYAAMWDHRRYPWLVRSGGPGSSIHKSIDGGATWKKLTKGLPEGMGKTSVDVSPANSNVVYANIEAEGEKGGVFRSDDGGASWRQTTKDRITVARAWYYIEVFADPQDENTVYVLNAPVLKSIDGGKTFSSISNPHGDQHHLWINPKNSNNIILSNDGGACVTFNGGDSWSSQQNQPTIQFYRVIADRQFPYHLYGGQQDNSSINTVSRTAGPGITWKDWSDGPGGESAFVAFDNPDNPKNLYGGSYQGNISIQNVETGYETDIMAYPVAGLAWNPSEMKYRFNWNSPIVASPQDPKVIYHGGNKVLKTTNGGITWSEISPDLTRNDKSKHIPGGSPYTIEGAGGEVYNTLAYIEASQHSDQVLWTGSDCGLVHVTTDGGANWSNVTPKDLGEVLINCIDVSPHDPSTAYVVATGYKFNDFQPMIFKTTNFGKSWKKMVNGIPADNFVRVVREDEKRKDLLFAGTELGLYISYNGGDKWEKFQLNLPLTPINDITFADNDLVIATAGRAFWILDDLSSLQQLGNKLENQVKIITPKDAYRISGGGRFRPGSLMGQNPESGIVVDYYLPTDMDSSNLKLEIWSGSELLRTYTNQKDKSFKKYIGGPPAPEMLPSKKGVNRMAWDMRKATIPGVENVFILGSYDGIMCPPDEYEVRLIVDDKTYSTRAMLKADSRIDATQSQYVEQYNLLKVAEQMVFDVQESVSAISEAKDQIQFLSKMESMPDTVKTLSKTIISKIDKWEGSLIQRKQKTFQDVINFPNGLNAEIVNLISRVSGANPIVTDGAKQRMSDLKGEYDQAIAGKKEIIDVDFAKFNRLIKSLAPDIIKVKEY